LNSPGHPKTAKSLDGIGCFHSARDREQVFGTIKALHPTQATPLDQTLAALNQFSLLL